jgi:hypothetical protein
MPLKGRNFEGKGAGMNNEGENMSSKERSPAPQESEFAEIANWLRSESENHNMIGDFAHDHAQPAVAAKEKAEARQLSEWSDLLLAASSKGETPQPQIHFNVIKAIRKELRENPGWDTCVEKIDEIVTEYEKENPGLSASKGESPQSDEILVTALKRIRDGSAAECDCDHMDSDCCANQPRLNLCCSFCIADLALKEHDENLPTIEEMSGLIDSDYRLTVGESPEPQNRRRDGDEA